MREGLRKRQEHKYEEYQPTVSRLEKGYSQQRKQTDADDSCLLCILIRVDGTATYVVLSLFYKIYANVVQVHDVSNFLCKLSASSHPVGNF